MNKNICVTLEIYIFKQFCQTVSWLGQYKHKNVKYKLKVHTWVKEIERGLAVCMIKFYVFIELSILENST